jgi:hypothetical protein
VFSALKAAGSEIGFKINNPEEQIAGEYY